MAYTPIVIGSLAWGAAVNNAFTSQDARITEIENQGPLSVSALTLNAMNMAPEYATGTSALVAGTVYMARVDIASPMTFSTITTGTIAAAVLTAAQNFAGIYDSTGTRVAVTADQSAAWAAAGEKNMAVTAPYVAAAGTYYVAFLSNGGTPLAPMRSAANANSAAFINHGLTVSNARWTTGPTAQTTLPASITMGTRTLSGFAYFAGLS